MQTTHPDVDVYINQNQAWFPILDRVRSWLLDADLIEMFKWKVPCYTVNNKNAIILSALKNHCVISFFNGAYFDDPNNLLTKPGENTQTARVIRLSDLAQVLQIESSVRSFIDQAIAHEKSDHVIKPKTIPHPIPSELSEVFQQDAKLQTAFFALTSGRQRAYLMHFSAPKTQEARLRRINKCRSHIFCGKGMHDCTCGHTKKSPSCDGSHKYFGDGKKPDLLDS